MAILLAVVIELLATLGTAVGNELPIVGNMSDVEYVPIVVDPLPILEVEKFELP